MVMLTLLTVVPFLLPANAKSKVILANALIISLFVFGVVLSTSVADAAKNASMGTPKIVMCFCITILLSILGAILSSFIVEASQCKSTAPCIVKKIFVDILAPIVYCAFLQKIAQNRKCKSEQAKKDKTDEEQEQKLTDASNEPTETSGEKEGESKCPVENTGCCLSKCSDWQIVAMVLNRICFLLFLAVALVVLCLYLPKNNLGPIAIEQNKQTDD